MNNKKYNGIFSEKNELRTSVNLLNAADLIEDLLNSSLDDEEHFNSSASLPLFNQDISNITQNIDQMDQLMDLLRPIIIKTLNKVKNDYKEFHKDKL